MITVLTILVILIVGYAQMREGLFTACCMLVNIVLAGIVAFGFFEPLANWLEPKFTNTFLAATEDFIALVGLFGVTLGLLRIVANQLVREMIAFNNNVQYGGGIIGLLSGYLLAGFLICAAETLPWHENFLGFTPKMDGDSGPRSVFPPDRVWLALMRHAGAHAFAYEEENPEAPTNYDRFITFDRYGTYEQRYLRYRRYSDTREPLLYRGELEKELHR